MSVFDRISQIHSRMHSMQSQFSNVSASNFAPSVATSGPACLNTPTAQTFEQILANSGLKPGEGVASSENISSNTAYKGSEKDFEGIIKDASKKYGVEEDFIRAIIKQESGFNPNAVSCCGAQGMMQLMPETAKDLGVKNAMDPRENIMGGVKYIKQMLDRYDGNKTKALAAYNAGPGNVDKYGGVPPFSETQNYVNNILSMYQEYKKS